MDPLVLEKASILCYRLYDVADEVDLAAAESLLARDVRRLRLSRSGAEYLLLPNPPLVIGLGRHVLPLPEGKAEVEARARLYDFGAASIVLSVPVPAGTPLDALVPSADRLYDGPEVDALAHELVEGVRRAVAPAMENPHLWSQLESYSVVFVQGVRGSPPGDEVLERADLARLLIGETTLPELSATERADVIRRHFSYGVNDLVVVDWNAAFVYEPSGSEDIPDVLDIANAQLLELRYYDDLLDHRLARVNDTLKRERRRLGSFFRSPYPALARQVQVTLLEMSEFIERVENSLKVIGDVYLARVYEAAVEQLRIPAWKASVTRKQQILGDIYGWLKGEVDTARSLTLEVMIVLLIVLELLVGATSLLAH
ncbi:MAG TPA: hypothetical protein VMH40_17025 [Myxococcaceae bacterium]|nr:hypothetical protein [Myxococcaceae bacterium]